MKKFFMKIRVLKTAFAGVLLFVGTGLSAQTNVFDDVIALSPAHSSLRIALEQEGLDVALRDPAGTFTVFAPDNDAFAALATALDTDIAGLLALPNLSDILLYHVLGQVVPSSAVTNGAIVSPLNTANTLKLTVDGTSVFVNQAQVNAVDLNAANGVVHSLDAVLLPGTTVADIAIGSGAHDVLVAAVIEARLLPALTDPFAELTVFAPTDDAFADALAALGISAGDLLASPDLTNILLYHVIGAEVASGDLENGMLATPLNNSNTLKVTIDGADVFINQAQVTAVDLPASNGLVHVLDAVVLPGTTVADIAIGSGAHDVLVAAVIEARLLPALTDPFAELTVFAPTDDAFADALAALGISAGDLLASPDLTNILLYHVIGAEVASGDLENGMLATPLNNSNTLKVTIDGADVFINQAQVTAVDLSASNGLVHVLDAVVLPGTTVADIAIGSGAHDVLVAAVIEARLLPALTDPFAGLTVFAPTDDAFADALAALGISAGDLLASPDLTDILLYHVIGAEVASGDLENGMLATPLNSSNTLKVTIDGADVFINQAQVTAVDLPASNGLVHVLDAVVLPGTTVADIAILSPAHTTLVAAVIEARLLPALTNPFVELTVFAPTDAAFTQILAELDLTEEELLASEDLTSILLYHVVGAAVLSDDLVAGPVATLNGADVTIGLGANVTVNNATVIVADLEAFNGVVHVINAVLLPPADPNASIADFAATNAVIYPNPAVEIIKVRDVENGSYAVINMMGAQVKEGAYTTNGIAVGDLDNGTYLIQIRTEAGTYQGRFVKF